MGFGELHWQHITDGSVGVFGAQTCVDVEREEDAGVALDETDELAVVGSVGAFVPEPELLGGAERGNAHLGERAGDAVHAEDAERGGGV